MKKRPVLYVGLEGENGLMNRVRAIEIEHRTPCPLHVMTGSFAMMTDDHTLEDVIGIANRFGAKLVVIDTLARAMAGGDENSAKDMSLLIARAQRIQTETGAHVSMIHHSGKDAGKGPRGSSVLKPAADVEIKVERKRGDLRLATFSKVKDGPDGDTCAFSIHGVSLNLTNEWGRALYAGVLRPAKNEEVAELPNTKPALPIDVEAFGILQKLTATDPQELRLMGWPTLEEWRNACRAQKWNPDAERWSQSFIDMKKRLVRDGFIEVEGDEARILSAEV